MVWHIVLFRTITGDHALSVTVTCVIITSYLIYYREGEYKKSTFTDIISKYLYVST